jgi:hypothetical protein
MLRQIGESAAAIEEIEQNKGISPDIANAMIRLVVHNRYQIPE